VTRRGLLNTARISGGQCARISGKVGVRISGTRTPAHAAGYRDFRPANSVYSNLGLKLRRALRLPLDDGLILAASFVDSPQQLLGQWVFRLRPEMVDALATVGWFEQSEFDAASANALVTKVAREGRLVLALRRHRHREQSLRRTKLRETLKRTRRLVCEVPGCGFDFASKYGVLGKAFAEVHHKKPLSSSDETRETRLRDLAVVCSNCHRIIHRDGGFRTLQEVGRCIRNADNRRAADGGWQTTSGLYRSFL